MDALFVASNLRRVATEAFLDLARRIVAFPLLFLEISRMEELLVFFDDGLPWWLAVWGFSPVGCWPR